MHATAPNRRARITRRSLALASALFTVVAIAAPQAPAAIAANYFSVADSGGVNDVNSAQVDLTQFGRDDTDLSVYKFFWSWDATNQWTGAGQTGDACALFDTDGDTNINYVICGQITNPNADPNLVTQTAGSPFVFTCADDKNDRCTNPVPVLYDPTKLTAGALTAGDPLPSPPANLITATDPFANANPDQNWPNDSTLEVVVQKSFLPQGATLVNVCSYPSAGNGGNTNPFDCIVTPGGGFLVLEKVAPAGTSQQFTFAVNPGALTETITGSGQTDPITLEVGSGVSVAEAVPAGWSLTAAACELEAGAPTGTRSGNTISSITIASGSITTCTFTNAGPPALGLTKTPDAPTVSAGTAIGFTLSVTNTGLGPAQGVQITDTLPTNSGLSWSVNGGSAAATCSITAGVLTCNVGTLAVGATATVHITSPTAFATCGTVNNSATATATNGSPAGPANGAVTVQCPNLTLTKTADAAIVSAGSTIGFTLTVSNSGPGAATGVAISDALPTGTGVTWSIDAGGSNAGCSLSTNTLTCSFGSLAANASRHVHVTSPTAFAGCKAYPNSATATATNHPSLQAQATTTVQCPNLGLTKTADAAIVSAGSTIGFTLTVSNSGPGTATGVAISDALPTGTGVTWSIDAGGSNAGCSIAANTLTCSFGSLAANASRHVHVTSPTTAQGCKAYPNSATATATNHPTVQAQATTTVNCGEIGLTKVADAASVSAGGQVGFVITAINIGAGTVTDVTVNDTLPAQAGLNWSIVAADSDAGCSIAGGVLTCTWGSLASQAHKSVHIVSPTTAASCAVIPNHAEVTTGNDGSDAANATTTVNCGAIGLTKTADAASVVAGSQIGFVVTAKNSGAGTATGVTVKDTLPAQAGLSWSIAAGSDAGCSIAAGVLTCDWGSFAPTAQKSVHVVSPTTTASCATIPNTATVTTTNDGTAQAGASSTVRCPAIAIDKTGPATAQAGDAILYTLVVTNPGQVSFAAQNVVVTDARCEAPPALLTTNGDPTPGELDPGDAWTYQCIVRTLAGQTSVTNIGDVSATDANGNVVNASDPATTALTGIQEAEPQPATARLMGPARCVRGPFSARVTGQNIAQVVFSLDNRRIKTVGSVPGRTAFSVRITPRRTNTKAHRVTARVTFKAVTGVGPRTLRLVFVACARRPAKFTG